MAFFNHLDGPVFLKRESEAQEQLIKLEALLPQARGETAEAIQRDISAVKAGLYGENQICFELENSYLPMLIFHDLFLGLDELSAQIDFLIITKKHCLVVECKNLFGDIRIDSQGAFIRKIQGGKQEGIYSPVTQNQRHLDLIRKLRANHPGSLPLRLFELDFSRAYRSVVVLANPKTVLHAQDAPAEIRDQVIRADQLVSFIRKLDNESGAIGLTEKAMMELGEFFLAVQKVPTQDYTEKYQLALPNQPLSESTDLPQSTPPARESRLPGQSGKNARDDSKQQMICPKCGSPMVRRWAKKGKNAGNTFWGCSRYPQCRGIVNIGK